MGLRIRDYPHRATRFGLVLTLLAGANLLGAGSVRAGLLDKLGSAGQSSVVELTDSVDKAAAFKEAFSEAGALAEASGPANFSLHKVAIAAFQIEFVTEQVGTARSGETKSDKSYTLKGVTEAQLQGVTEKMYHEFATLLIKRGFEVVPTAQLLKTSFKGELMAPNDGPVKTDENSLLGDVANSTDLVKRTGNSSMVSVTATAKGTAPGAFKTRFLAPPAARAAADELGIAVVQVRLKLNFMQFDETGGFGVAKLEGKPRNSLALRDSRLDLFWPGSQMAQFALKKTVLLPSAVANDVTEVAMTTTDKAGAAAKGLLGVAQGIMGFGAGSRGQFVPGSKMTQLDAAGSAAQTAVSISNSGRFEVTAQGDYDEKLGSDIRLALQMYVEALPK